MSDYFRPIPQFGPARPEGALPLAGGWTWFTEVEHLRRDQAPVILPAAALPEAEREALTAARAPIAGLDFSRPNIMGILNVTPDSFSDGGLHNAPAQAVNFARQMVADGADIIDVGGESTRPGALEVPVEAEIARTAPVIQALRRECDTPISIDTRKAVVADEALSAGASLVNDVSGFTFDKALTPLVRDRGVPICVMHAQGDPATMQDNPTYDDVLLDVYDFLAAQVAMLTGAGIARDRIVLDPGIGFGKTIQHNLDLLARLSLFHTLGCTLLLGASRKGFIRVIGEAPEAQQRLPGSLAVALAGVAQGVQITRVHDVAETRQAFALWRASTEGKYDGA